MSELTYVVTAMREAISKLMLTLDEVWLTHADRIRFNRAVTQTDVQLENILFKVESQLIAASALLPVVKRADPELGSSEQNDKPGPATDNLEPSWSRRGARSSSSTATDKAPSQPVLSRRR
jgi:hypothetical protein